MYNYSYNSGAQALSGNDFGAALGAILGAFIGIHVVIGIVAILLLVANWMLFKKMGYEGWKSLIPGANTYLVMEKIGVSQKWLVLITFGSLVCIIPVIGFLALLVALVYYAILYNVSLAKAFGKSGGFAAGLILLSPIFILILAFGDSKYIGPDPMNDILFGKKTK